MGNSEPKDKKESGMNRRDMLKVMGTGALLSLIPGYGLGGSAAAFSPAKGQGLIVLVGDGMPLGVIKGMHEVKTRFYGDKDSVFYARMRDEHSALGFSATHSLSSVVTDSAPGSVAWSTGTKTANKILAALPDGRPLRTIMELLKDQGYACGLATTTRVTHATPAAWVSHQTNRDQEAKVALDYLKFKPDVLLGGGSRYFAPSARKDGLDLFKLFSEAGYDLVKDRKGLLSPELLTSPKPLLGTFASSHLDYYLDRKNQVELGNKQPSLPEMTRMALQKLSRNPKGFILQVEAGRIDHANHNNDAWAAIQETIELDLTLSVVEEYLKENPKTLVVIVSDHGTACFGINGTGPEYNDSTEALSKYQPIKASFDYMRRKIKKDASPAEIKDLFESFTTYRISDQEASMIIQSMQPDYRLQQGDYTIQPQATMGRILAHSIYEKITEIYWDGKAVLRRGNVGFTSSHHTAEDQIVLAYGHRARDLGLGRHIDNTYLFTAMCRYFGLTFKNPSMTEEEARSYLKTVSLGDWHRHMKLHIC
jgi:alkaline phosphatase